MQSDYVETNYAPGDLDCRKRCCNKIVILYVKISVKI